MREGDIRVIKPHVGGRRRQELTMPDSVNAAILP